MMSLELLSIVGILAPATCSDCNRADGHLWIDQGLITAVSPRPALSGIVRTFVRLTVRDGDGGSNQIYQTYVSDSQFVPLPGSVCRISYHYERNSSPKLAEGEPERFMIANSMTCDTGNWSIFDY